ncbi:MAG: ABC transporter ATP-binding protein [Spirochaetaceae bacterium]|nr:MAG: ABC transporter ATP-binding protein [Spirochaetaceae bacterium]
MVLDVRGLTMDFGGLRAVDQVDLQVNEGEIVALIGPNGAGKTTFFNCVTGMYVPTAGTVTIARPGTDARQITRMRPHLITAQGLARTFQNIRLFPEMTVLENVMIGRDCRLSAGILGAIMRNKKTVAEEKQVVLDSYAMLEIVGIGRWANETAKNLPYGAQRRLEIARALATEPFLLLLDEPAAGMNPQETRDLVALIRRLRTDHQLSIFLIEHDMSLVMTLSERIYVMDYGKLIAVGDPGEVRRDPSVIKAYLGEDVSA